MNTYLKMKSDIQKKFEDRYPQNKVLSYNISSSDVYFTIFIQLVSKNQYFQ